MQDGLRWPARGIISWLSKFGIGVDIKASKHSCVLEFNTAEQYMAFRFKFDSEVVNGMIWFKHFAISEKEWLESAAERAWLSHPRISPVHYQLHYCDGKADYWRFRGPEMSEHHENKWSMARMDDLRIFRKCFIGGQKGFVREVTTALEIISELRTIWVDAPVMLQVPNEKSFHLVNITDQDPLFVTLMK
jgi:hypothetical protein